MNIKILHGDCREEYKKIEDGSVDLFLVDPPYGNMKGIDVRPTASGSGYKKQSFEWDEAIDPFVFFEIANKKLRKNGRLVLFSQEPYSSLLIQCKEKQGLEFNYRMIWKKDVFANCLLSKKAAVKFHEDVLVFQKKHDTMLLHPLREYASNVKEYIAKSEKELRTIIGDFRLHHFLFRCKSSQFSIPTKKTYDTLIEKFSIDKMEGFKEYKEIKKTDEKFKAKFNLWEGKKYKSDILEYRKEYGSERFHPTQKPILLLEDLIKTFTNEGDLVVDLTMGSGSTGIAAINTKREFIGIEKDPGYFEIAKNRISKRVQEEEEKEDTKEKTKEWEQ
jgi:site-specific DNA-methyltransferase (adenine-specific)